MSRSTRRGLLAAPLRQITVAVLSFASASQCLAAKELAKGRIMDFATDIQKRNLLRLSRTGSCEECVTLEDFYANNPLAFVLFFERSLISQHKYKGAIVAGFHEACEELRWSRVVCGLVDILEDREYAARYISPETAPAHIVVRHGEPQLAQKHHVEALMQKPGDKETMLWHLRDLLAPGQGPGALDTSAEAADSEIVARLLDRHAVVIASAVGSGQSARDAFRTAARSLVLSEGVPREVTLPGRDGELLARVQSKGAPPIKHKELTRWRRARERARVLFLAVHGPKAAAAYGLVDGQVVAFIDGKPAARSETRGAIEGSAGVARLAKALRAALEQAIKPAASSDEGRVPDAEL